MEPTAEDVTRAVSQEAASALEASLEKIRHCCGQLSDEQVWWRPTASMNSIGNLILHLGGNLRQWIVSGIGGAEDVRDRPAEFAARGPVAKEALIRGLEQVVNDAKAALARAAPAAMLAERRIQGVDVTGWGAVFHTIPHFQGHAQEIVHLTRIQLGDGYRVHWQPQSAEQGAPTKSTLYG